MSPDMNGIRWAIGLVLISTGLAIGLWSWRLWRNPGSLSPESLIYHYFRVDWHTWPRRRAGFSEVLTTKQIRYYAVRGMSAGLLLAVVGVILITA